MDYKILLAIGNSEIEGEFEKVKDIEIADKERDLETLKDLMEFININYLVLNRLLDEDGEKLIDIAILAKQRNIKIIMILDNVEDFSEKKIITALVAQDVYAFIRFNEISEENISNLIKNYPEEFDFSFLHKEKQQVATKIKAEKKPVLQKTETVEIELINNAVITIYSNCSSGKSFITWILSCCLLDRDYRTAIINLDKGYSVNTFFGVDNDEYNGMFTYLSAVDPGELCYNPEKNLSIVCGPLGSSDELDPDQFLKVLNEVRIKNNITIVDCKSELNKLTRVALQQSTVDILVYDIDVNHYNLNFYMLKELGKGFNAEKTILVINNAILGSESYKMTLQNIKDSGLSFRDIITIRNCGAAAQDLMFSGTTPYFDNSTSEEFKNDINLLLDSLKSRRKAKGFFKRFFRR